MAEGENIVSNFDFSKGLQPWYRNRGDCETHVVSTSTLTSRIWGRKRVKPITGSTYAVVTRRTEWQQGLEQDITGKIMRDKNYVISAYVRVSGEVSAPSTVLFILKMEIDDRHTDYRCVGLASASTRNWEKLHGSFYLQKMPRRLMFYLEGPPAKMDLLINSVTISLSDECLFPYQKLDKARTAITKEYEKFRKWIEDQASNSYGMVRFTEFSLTKVEAAINDTNKVLGQGGYGSVLQAVIDGKSVAIKIPKDNEHSEQTRIAFNQEVEILRRIRHPNLVTLIGACPENNALIYEFLPNGSLLDRLSKDMSWKERIKIAASICSALVFLHNTKPNPIAHGDLKPNNILFDSNNECKLSDFGISRVLKYTNDTRTPNHSTSIPKGTKPYMDPEYNLTGKLTPQSDIFAFGIILLQLVTGEVDPFTSRNYVSELVKNKNLKTIPAREQESIIKKLQQSELLDAPIDEVVGMICLGFSCSEHERKKRPNLETEVWIEIDSMYEDASEN